MEREGFSRAMFDAQTLLARHFAPTPLVRAPSLDSGNRTIHLKIESGLPTGSFKVRGAVYALSKHVERNGAGPVLAASTGNHGAAVAFAGRLLKVPVTIFLPKGANPVKTRRILDQGARIVAVGHDLSAAIDAAYAEAARTGAFFLPMGDTALVRGVASAAIQAKPSIRVIGVAAANAPAYYLSWRAGEAVSTEAADTIADGLAVRRALAANVSSIAALLDDVRLVEEDELLFAMAHLIKHEGVVAEPAGAAATAALMKDVDTAGTIVSLLTGSNVAPDVAERVAARANLR
jgi:threonine dehydratase